MLPFSYSILFFFAIISLLNGCSSSSIENRLVIAEKDPLYIDFCNFPEHLDKKVRIVGNYYGIQEYWSLSSTIPCDSLLTAQLDWQALHSNLSQGQDTLLQKYKQHSNYYLIIDAVGHFNMDNKMGYGHLGHNKAIFIVDSLLDLQLGDMNKLLKNGR
jgi:hypothetical protein